MSQILVTYASRTGSTVGVADAIAKTLIENDADVELLPVENVNDITPYGAVVAGSAIQNRQWLPEAMQFLQTHRAELGQRPFATFTVCMTLAMRNGEKYRLAVSDWLVPVRVLVRPLNEGLFSGVLDIGKIPAFGDRLKFRLSVLFGVWAEGDHRDWEAIRAWANELYPQLQVGETI